MVVFVAAALVVVASVFAAVVVAVVVPVDFSLLEMRLVVGHEQQGSRETKNNERTTLV